MQNTQEMTGQQNALTAFSAFICTQLLGATPAMRNR